MGFIIGAFLGSFLNMAIYRLPRGLSFVEPSRSFCPKCKHSLGGADLMPILSWVLARGKCRYCKEPVASRYFWVEVLTGTLFALIWWRYLVDSYEPARAVAYMATTACLVAIIFIDAELYIIPDEINALLLVIALAYHGAQHTLSTALWGALLGWGLLFGIQLLGRIGFGKDAMGDGDTKMMRGIGALIGGWLLVGNLVMAVVLGLVYGIVNIALQSRAKGNKESNSSDSAQQEPAEEESYLPTPIPTLILAGVCYFFCVDVFALFLPPVRQFLLQRFPDESIDEEDDWKPSATTIPFGPFLAAGALACMIFAAPIENGLKAYFRVGGDTGPAVSEPSQASNLAPQ